MENHMSALSLSPWKLKEIKPPKADKCDLYPWCQPSAHYKPGSNLTLRLYLETYGPTCTMIMGKIIKWDGLDLRLLQLWSHGIFMRWLEESLLILDKLLPNLRHMDELFRLFFSLPEFDIIPYWHLLEWNQYYASRMGRNFLWWTNTVPLMTIISSLPDYAFIEGSLFRVTLSL